MRDRYPDYPPEYDYPEYLVLNEKHIRRARKTHKCSDCVRTIEVGEPYTRTIVVDGDGTFSMHKSCARHAYNDWEEF